MALTVKVLPQVALPDLAAIEALAQAQVKQLQPEIDAVKDLYAARLKELNVTTPDVEKLVQANPKLIDNQLRGKLATLARLEKDLAKWQAVPAALAAVKAKVEAGTEMFQVVQRPWGRTRSRLLVTITDKDLLVLHQLGLLA